MNQVTTDNLRVLLLCDDKDSHANTVLDHIKSFHRYSSHDVTVLNPTKVLFAFGLNFNRYDVVIIHYSVCIIYRHYLPKAVENKLKKFTGLTVLFIQDEYRWVNSVVDKMLDINVDLLFTCAPSSEVPKLYQKLLDNGVTILPTLTGYVPENNCGYQPCPISERNVDVVYRGRDIPMWLGALAREKVDIGLKFKALAQQTDLICDIAWNEEDRIYGERWNEFIGSSKATLGTESGASIADFDGKVELKVKEFQFYNPGVSFEELSKKVLKPFEGNVVVNVISPRIFEAASLKTALVLFPGSYSGALEAGRNFIKLEKDFSNFENVVGCLKNDQLLQSIADQAYKDLIESDKYSYQSFMDGFDKDVSAEFERRDIPRVKVSMFSFPFIMFQMPELGMDSKVRTLAWSLNLLFQKIFMKTAFYFSVGKVLGMSAYLIVKKKLLRNLIRKVCGMKTMPTAEEFLRLVVQSSRLMYVQDAKVQTIRGKESLYINPEIHGEVCILKIVLAPQAMSLPGEETRLFQAFESGEVKKIEWLKTSEVENYPMLLQPDIGCFSVLGPFANKCPREVVDMIIECARK